MIDKEEIHEPPMFFKFEPWNVGSEESVVSETSCWGANSKTRSKFPLSPVLSTIGRSVSPSPLNQPATSLMVTSRAPARMRTG